MSTPIPLNQSPKEICLALLNRDNSTNFTLNQIDFISMEPTQGSFARNTKITVTALPNAPYSGTEDVFYNRLDLAEQWATTVCVARIDGPTNAVDLLPAINATYELNITADDIVNDAVTGDTHELIASASSLIWTGSVMVTIIPEIVDPELPLVEEFENAGLPGFQYNPGFNYTNTTENLMYGMLTSMNSSPVDYGPGHFTISNVTLGGSAELANVTLTAVGGSGFTGTHLIEYTRISLSEFFDNLNISVDAFLDMDYAIGEEVDPEDILALVNSISGLLLSSTDLNITSLILTPGSSFTIQATVSNYLNYGVVEFTLAESEEEEPVPEQGIYSMALQEATSTLTFADDPVYYNMLENMAPGAAPQPSRGLGMEEPYTLDEVWGYLQSVVAHYGGIESDLNIVVERYQGLSEDPVLSNTVTFTPAIGLCNEEGVLPTVAEPWDPTPVSTKEELELIIENAGQYGATLYPFIFVMTMTDDTGAPIDNTSTSALVPTPLPSTGGTLQERWASVSKCYSCSGNPGESAVVAGITIAKVPEE